MKKVLGSIGKWILRIILGILGLIVLIFMLFYLFRGVISQKAQDIINDKQPGELQFEKMNLRPFMAFPAVSLQLSELEYIEPLLEAQPGDSISILRMDDIFLSLDILRLIKGEYRVSKVRFADGQINYVVREDSISNIERALGIRFGSDTTTVKDTTAQSELSFDLEQLQIRNLVINYVDLTDTTTLHARINGLESGFSYYPDTITASVMMHMNLFEAGIAGVVLDNKQSVSLNASLLYDMLNGSISMDRTALAMNKTMFEIEGDVQLEEEIADIRFNAKNRGAELLNFLFKGVLDLDAISQIGLGEITMDGTLNGSYGNNNLPLAEVNILAEEMAFRIHTIEQEVKDITFKAFLTNGTEKDFSKSYVNIEGFHVTIPEGELNTSLEIRNLVTPHVSLDLDGYADLSILNEILETDSIKDMEGMLEFKGSINGEINKGAGEFLDNAGSLEFIMSNVGVTLPDNIIENANGTIYAEGRRIGFREFNANVDSNDIFLDGVVDDFAPYFMGFDADPSVSLSLRSPRLDINSILKDSVLPLPLNDLAFTVDLDISGENLTRTLEEGAIPLLDLSMKGLRVSIPGYQDIRNTGFNLSVEKELFDLKSFQTLIGGSNLSLSAQVHNYQALLDKDSSRSLSADIKMQSSHLKFKDLLTLDNEFIILPEPFEKEEIRLLNFEGYFETTVAEILDTNDIPDVSLALNALDLDLKYYENSLNNVVLDFEKRDSMLHLNFFEGNIGENNIAMFASLANVLDSTRLISGDVYITSNLLDVDDLMDYPLLFSNEENEEAKKDTTKSSSANLHAIDLPDVKLNLDVAEFRFQGNELFGLDGQIRLKPYHIIYLDRFALQSSSGGSVLLDGQFNIADSTMYVLSATMEIDTLDLGDFDVQIAMGDTLYSLEDNFNGIISADGITELFLQPDMSINIDTSSAIFNLRIQDGRVRNFTPLQAISKYTGNADLNDVQFDELRNSFTLSDGAVQIPLMLINSTIGNLWIEGEQVLDGEFLYLARVPVRLISGTAWNVVSNQQRKDTEEEEVEEVEIMKVAVLTVASGEDGKPEVKLGDKRDKYLEKDE